MFRDNNYNISFDSDDDGFDLMIKSSHIVHPPEGFDAPPSSSFDDSSSEDQYPSSSSEEGQGNECGVTIIDLHNSGNEQNGPEFEWKNVFVDLVFKKKGYKPKKNDLPWDFLDTTRVIRNTNKVIETEEHGLPAIWIARVDLDLEYLVFDTVDELFGVIREIFYGWEGDSQEFEDTVVLLSDAPIIVFQYSREFYVFPNQEIATQFYQEATKVINNQ